MSVFWNLKLESESNSIIYSEKIMSYVLCSATICLYIPFDSGGLWKIGSRGLESIDPQMDAL